MRIIDALSERPMRVSGRTSTDSLRPPLDGTAHRCSDDDEDQLDWPDRLRGILRGSVGGRLAASMDAAGRRRWDGADSARPRGIPFADNQEEPWRVGERSSSSRRLRGPTAVATAQLSRKDLRCRALPSEPRKAYPKPSPVAFPIRVNHWTNRSNGLKYWSIDVPCVTTYVAEELPVRARRFSRCVTDP